MLSKKNFLEILDGRICGAGDCLRILMKCSVEAVGFLCVFVIGLGAQSISSSAQTLLAAALCTANPGNRTFVGWASGRDVTSEALANARNNCRQRSGTANTHVGFSTVAAKGCISAVRIIPELSRAELKEHLQAGGGDYSSIDLVRGSTRMHAEREALATCRSSLATDTIPNRKPNACSIIETRCVP